MGPLEIILSNLSAKATSPKAGEDFLNYVG